MNKVIISLGGSLITPDRVDTAFLKSFRQLVIRHADRMQFFIICGGGSTCRQYQNAASSIVKLKDEDLDWLGIHATRLNAQLVKTVLKDYAYRYVIKDPTAPINAKESVVVAAGWKPGFSTDYDAVLLAKNIGIKTIANLSDIDYVYDKDPKRHTDAKPITTISWSGFRKLLTTEWKPGLNAPFDPIAAKEAEKLGLKVAVIGSIHELDKFLNNKSFMGTIIE